MLEKMGSQRNSTGPEGPEGPERLEGPSRCVAAVWEGHVRINRDSVGMKWGLNGACMNVPILFSYFLRMYIHMCQLLACLPTYLGF